MYLSWEDFGKRVAAKQQQIRDGLPLRFYDDTTLGSKSMDCTWGQCSQEYAADDFLPGQTCPFDRLHDKRSGLMSGCFWSCDIFKPVHRGPRMTAEAAEQKYVEWAARYGERAVEVQATFDDQIGRLAARDKLLDQFVALTTERGLDAPKVVEFRQHRHLQYRRTVVSLFNHDGDEFTVDVGGGRRMHTTLIDEAVRFCCEVEIPLQEVVTLERLKRRAAKDAAKQARGVR